MTFTIPAKDTNAFLDKIAQEYAESNGFQIVERLPSLCTGVYKAKKDEAIVVIKAISTRIKEASCPHGTEPINPIDIMKAMYLESVILESLKQTPNLPRLHSYQGPRNPGLLSFPELIAGRIPVTCILVRDYIDGRVMGKRNGNSFSRDFPLIENPDMLEDVVHAIHSIGYADLDLIPPNVVIDTQNRPYFIDL
ncbi:MAG: hypothetical protein ACMXX5_01615, partial [Candidatus Woesearchaeota archaeon]